VPHIVVEYAEQLADDVQINDILQAVHRSITASGLFDESHIKTRAYPFRHYTNAGSREPYIHIQARIKSGRDEDNKIRLSEEILAGLRPLNIAASVITVEVIDMDRSSYGKFKPT
jgi:5-carboxymethyl-2-hydroxymuconate isomerase